MVRFNEKAKKEDQGPLVLDLAKALERVSLPVVGLGDAFQFPKRMILRVLCGYYI